MPIPHGASNIRTRGVVVSVAQREANELKQNTVIFQTLDGRWVWCLRLDWMLYYDTLGAKKGTMQEFRPCR